MTLLYYIKGTILTYLQRARNLFPAPPLKKVNTRFKNIHSGEDLFVLGSGPSITTQDLKKLAGRTVMTQNHFHAHKDILTINPTYHVVVPKFHTKEYDKDWIEWINSMETKLPETTKLFVGSNTKYLIDDYSTLSNRTFYMDHGLDPVFLNKAYIDISKMIMTVQTVITQCITVALYMNFKRIYLIGFDLDQIVHLAKDRDKVRFYGNSPITANKAEKDIENASNSSGLDWYNQWLIWKQLNLLKTHAEERKIEIINLTNGGLLNVFLRDRYEDIVK